jgi:hypothetical protein
MPRFGITVVMDDGTKEHAEGELAPLPDRVAFERRFGLSATVMQDLDQDRPDPHVLREEWIAFLAWRMLWRAHATPWGDFDQWVEHIEGEIEVNPLDGPPLVRTGNLPSSPLSGDTPPVS